MVKSGQQSIPFEIFPLLNNYQHVINKKTNKKKTFKTNTKFFFLLNITLEQINRFFFKLKSLPSQLECNKSIK